MLIDYNGGVTAALWVSATVAVVIGLALATFTRWRRAARDRVLTDGRVAQTALGPVEYAVSGSGPVVMVLHGGFGGFDQGLLLGKSVGIHKAFTMLCPSRAGYLRTPLTTCRTPEETADALAALLDTLGHGKVAVVGISGGGPTALQFALRHAGRAEALVMLAAISRRHEQPERTRKIFGWFIFSGTGMWFIDLVCWIFWVGLWRRRPWVLAGPLFRATETLDATALAVRLAQFKSDPRQCAWLREFMAMQLPLSLRKTGLDNDLAQFAGLPEYPVGRIACPTLVVHGRFDGNVPLEHAEFVARGVPGATLHVAEGCGHMYMLSAAVDEANARVMGFLRQHVGAAGGHGGRESRRV